MGLIAIISGGALLEEAVGGSDGPYKFGLGSGTFTGGLAAAAGSGTGVFLGAIRSKVLKTPLGGDLQKEGFVNILFWPLLIY